MSTKNFVSYGDAETLFTDVGNKLSSLKSGLTNLDNEVNGDATVYPYADVITIPDAVPANVADCKVKIEPVQSGSGDPSPTNIRPITGHTEASVQRDGKNLLNIADCSYENGTVTVKDGLVKINGTFSAKTVMIGSYANIAELNNFYGKVLTFSKTDVKGNMEANPIFFTAEGRWDYWHMSNSTNSKTITLDMTLSNLVLYLNGTFDVEFYLQVELGSTATPFEPYQGKTYTIALGDTIYGGTVDFDSGVMTVDRKGVDMGALTWTYHAAGGEYTEFFDTNLPNDSIVGDAQITANIISPLYKTIPSHYIAQDGYDNGVQALARETRRLITCDKRYSNAADYTNAVDGNILVYELATPTTIQLTPKQIQLLKGTNTLTASTGQISITVNGVSGAIGAVQEQVNDLTDCIGWGERWNLYTGNGTKNLDCTGRIIPNNYDNPLPKDTYTVSFNLAETPSSSSSVQFVAWDVSNNVVINTTKSLAKGHNFITAEANGDIAKLTLNTNNSNSGTYSEIMIIRGDDTEHIYQPYHPVIGTAVEELLAKVPDAPTTDGAYVLTVTVADGTPTYSWESAT